MWLSPEAFLDLSISPTHFTRSISIHGFPPVTEVGTDTDDWIRTFRGVTHLYWESPALQDGKVSLVPLRGFPSTVESLRLNFAPFEVFDLVCSFPLLEDLTLIHPLPKNDTEQCIVPSTPPNFTGPLEPKISGDSLCCT